MNNFDSNKKRIEDLIDQKKILRDNLDKNIDSLFTFYQAVKTLSIDELKKLFPAPRAVVEQNNFDATSRIISSDTIEELAFTSMALFRRSNTEKSNPELFRKDMELLQALFFFFIRDIVNEDENSFSESDKRVLEELFENVLQNGTWYKCEIQKEILNTICSKLNYLRNNPFSDIDFTHFKGNHFEANESILRLFVNFQESKQGSVPKDKIISELNFIREQQKSILSFYPNTYKTDYSEAEVKLEISEKAANLAKLKDLDFGFSINDFTQFVFVNDEKLNENPFVRKITCKFFQESELEWKKGDPEWSCKGKVSKILARKNDRITNKSALTNKFLYPERNMVTHISENFAVYNLFGKGYKESQIGYWESLVLYSMYDARNYLLEISNNSEQRANAERLLKILNYYFKKIVGKQKNLQKKSDEELWSSIFDERGYISLKPYQLDKTNISNGKLLKDDEIKHFRKFMSFLYCSENEAVDFFEAYRTPILFYLIYLTFTFSKIDSKL